MSNQPKIACIAGQEIYRQCDVGKLSANKLPPRKTPFGDSGEMLLVNTDGASFYLLPRYGLGMAKIAPRTINYRANMYAIKDMGVDCVLAWGPGGAITHSMAVGDLMLLDDVIDHTCQRAGTFFENSPLGFLRQFPVFCPSLRRAAAESLSELKMSFREAGTAAVCEGPRLETPAEVRMLATMGAGMVTHSFVPEVFLARELQMCYAAICYVVNYAETGSKHRPFAAGELFGGLTQKSDALRLESTVGAMGKIVATIAAKVAAAPQPGCECHKTMVDNIARYNLSADWRSWFVK